MPQKLSSPSKHGGRTERLYARKVSPVNKNDFKPSKYKDDSSKGSVSRLVQRYTTAVKRGIDIRSLSGRGEVLRNTWNAQEKLRSENLTPAELTQRSKNYQAAREYHSSRGNYDKAQHFHNLSVAAKTESTTAKRVATTAKNKAGLTARIKATSERIAAKQVAKSVKSKTSNKSKTTKS